MEINTLRPLQGQGKKLFVETYGCQMNVGDSEIVVSIMQSEGWRYTDDPREADVILINTCSIRDNAEQRIWGRLAELRGLRRRRQGVLIGIIGCMAERLKERLTEGEDAVDIVAGPDAYRDLPKLVREAGAGGKGINVLLSREETYAEIAPVRLDRNGVSAFVAIMRGCNNYCSYCVVPYTRGIERSRDPETILAEVRSLFANGYREVTLLGQNVNSYRAGEVGFPELISRVADVSPLLRVRYLPDCAVTTDLIAGFSGETEEEHAATLSLMREVGYEFAYMFKYSERPGTFASKHLPDDVPDEVKTRRLSEIIALQNELSEASNRRDVGREFEVLVEGRSKRSDAQLSGRTSQNKVVVFDRGGHGVGEYVRVRITGCSSATLFGEEIK